MNWLARLILGKPEEIRSWVLPKPPMPEVEEQIRLARHARAVREANDLVMAHQLDTYMAKLRARSVEERIRALEDRIDLLNRAV